MGKVIILLGSIFLGLFLMFFMGMNYQKQLTEGNNCEQRKTNKKSN
jgi:hypothetical protein